MLVAHHESLQPLITLIVSGGLLTMLATFVGRRRRSERR